MIDEGQRALSSIRFYILVVWWVKRFLLQIGLGKRDQNVQKSTDRVAEILNAQSARTARQLNLDDRIEKLAQKEAFTTLKDYYSGP